jgi:PIF1-like helicase/Helitron helicase-like domain at N-terminus
MMTTNLQTNRHNWPLTQSLLSSITPVDLQRAARQAELHQAITNPGVKELLKQVNFVGQSAVGSDEKKSHMLVELKSSMVYYGCPTIFLTLNPGERHSPLALLYSGEEIDIRNFCPELFTASLRLTRMMENPLAVIEYFHNTMCTIIETMLKNRGLFGELLHYYGPIEYQGRGTPHTHIAVRFPTLFDIIMDSNVQIWITGPISPHETREHAKADDEFRNRLLQYVSQVATECMPLELTDHEQSRSNVGHRIFSPYPDPQSPSFDIEIALDLYDIVQSRQMHSLNHTPTCFKYGNGTCRSHFPRPLVSATTFDEQTGVIHIERDYSFLNGYNPWLSLVTRANHDCQFLFTKNHALAIIHYVMKYISKPEASLHSKLTIAAAVRRIIIDSPTSSYTDISKQILLKTYNKLDSHREVGIPEALSHLLHFPDHFTHGTFQSINTTHLLHFMRRLADAQMNVAPESTELFDANIIRSHLGYTIVSLFEDYACRGQHLSYLPLYDYCSLFYKQKCNSGHSFTIDHPQHTTHKQVLRQTIAGVPVLLGRLLFLRPHSDDVQATQDYYCLLTGLFLPWSYETSIKPTTTEWEVHYSQHCHTLPPRLQRYIYNLDLLHKSHEESQIDRLQRQALNVDTVASDPPQNHGDPEGESSSDFVPTGLSSSFNLEEVVQMANRPTQEWYVREAVDANWDNEYFSSLSSDGILNLNEGVYQCDISQRILRSALRSIGMSHVGPPYIDQQTLPPTQPHVYISEMEVTFDIDSISRHFNLNDEQTLAFRIVVNQSLGFNQFGEQLLMGVFGEGGTGKSQLIRAIKAWFDHIHQQDRLVVTAMTGTAAAKIDGCTLHSGVGIPVERGDRGSRRISIAKQAEWVNRQFLIVDEVSMMDCNIIARLNTHLCVLKSNSSELFGGVNIIFFGDFLQFPAVSRLDLYLDNIRCHEGHTLWRSLNAVVILRQQMRQINDTQYAQLLRRVRARSPTDEDIQILNSRIGAPMDDIFNIPFIVRRHSVRHAINSEALLHFADAFNTNIIHCVAIIKNLVNVTPAEAYQCKYGERGMDGDAVLSIAPGVPLLITKNIDSALGMTTFLNVWTDY